MKDSAIISHKNRIIIFILIIILQLIDLSYSQNSDDEIIFYSNGRTFSPIISIQGNATILWTFADSTTSTITNPNKDYGTEGFRVNRLKVTPWSAIRMINIGYDASDGGSKSIPFVADQKISRIENLSLSAPYLETWCSSYNLLDSLNFDNFVNLKTIECFRSVNVKKVSLKNTPNLKRLCLEDNDLKSLDLSESTSLEDFRAALNDFQDIHFSNSTEEMWHLCIRENHSISNSNMFSAMQNFPAMRELLIWGTNQSGEFKINNTIGNTILILASQNKYTKLDLSGALLVENGIGEVNFRDNKLTSVNISGCRQITDLNLSNNLLSADSVDKILRQLDELETTNRVVKLQGNAPPTPQGMIHKSNLESKGWTVSIESVTGPEINIIGNGVAILNGDSSPSEIDLTDFGSVNESTGKITHTFIIQNFGTDTLSLTGSDNLIDIFGSGSSDFYVSLQPSKSIAPGEYSNLEITFDPTLVGLRIATVSISNNDHYEDPFTFQIQGVGFLSDIEFEDGSSFYPEIIAGFTNQVIGRFRLKAEENGAYLTSLKIKIIGSGSGLSNVKLWASTDSVFTPNFSEQLSNTIITDPLNKILEFENFTSNISTNGLFYFLTADIDSSANGNVICFIENNNDLTINGGLLNSLIDSVYLSNGQFQIPVELYNLTANTNLNQVNIYWDIASEINNLGFEIERMNISNREECFWETIDFIKSRGNSSELFRYSFQDILKITGKYKYRIKQIDFNGTYKYYYLPEVIDFSNPTTFALFQNYPNPFNSFTKINFQIPDKSLINLSVFDILGNKLFDLLNEEKEAGYYNISFYGNEIASGIYIYKIRILSLDNEKRELSDAKKMILVK